MESHRVVCLVDANEEDELGEEEGGDQVAVDGMQVGAQAAEEEEEEEGKEECCQGGADGGVGDDLQREHVSMLGEGAREGRGRGG